MTIPKEIIALICLATVKSYLSWTRRGYRIDIEPNGDAFQSPFENVAAVWVWVGFTPM